MKKSRRPKRIKGQGFYSLIQKKDEEQLKEEKKAKRIPRDLNKWLQKRIDSLGK
jgi:hypothetical protein